MADKPTVLATNALHPDGDALIAPHARLIVAPDTADDTLRKLARGVDGIIVRAKLPDDIFEHAPRLKGAVRHGVGLDFIPVEAATAKGIAVANLPGCNTRSVAEYVFAALMQLRRPLGTADAVLRGKGWNAARRLVPGSRRHRLVVCVDGGDKRPRRCAQDRPDEAQGRADQCGARSRRRHPGSARSLEAGRDRGRGTRCSRRAATRARQSRVHRPQALWDIRGKACGWPLYRLLGGASKPIKAYAGGISLGFQPPAALAEEAAGYVASGYRALKLRVGDTPQRDIERVEAVRKALGSSVEILVDANTGYSLDDVRRVMPAYEELGVAWLEEPFPAHDYRDYKIAAGLGRVPLAAGENHFTRFEFTRLIEDGAVRFAQPDLSKTGGVTEAMRIAAMLSAWKISFNPHTSLTSINMAASIHALAAVDNAGYFEGDVTGYNPFRDNFGTEPYALDKYGCVSPLESPGHGIDVDEAFVAAHPLIDGPCYV